MFEDALRKALMNLYDPSFLRKSPLLRLFSLDDNPNPAGVLRQTLEWGIKAMQQRAVGSSPLVGESRYYEILHYRYVQQITQRDVANHLGITPRHLRREQAAAIGGLAEVLRVRLQLPDDVDGILCGATSADQSLIRALDMDREMDWLGDSLSQQVIDLAPILQEATQLARAMAQNNAVLLDLHTVESLPPVHLTETVLKQLILTLVTMTISCVPGGQVSITAQSVADDVVIQVTARPSAREEVREPDAEALEMAVRLTQMAGGRLQLPQTDVPGRQMLATLRLTPAERITVLAIEDNHDTLQLWDRYLHGTPFRLIGVQQPDEALAVAQEVEPEIILLDVMMPNVDGWSLLGRLRLHPATSGVPVIVCTVLPQRELALSLGASDFARKPLTRQAFLALLERQNVVSRRR